MLRRNILIPVLFLMAFEAEAQMELRQIVYNSDEFPAVKVAEADFNSDGVDDYLIASSCLIVSEDAVVDSIFWDSSYEVTEPLIGDLDLDGDLDFVHVDNSTILAFLNDGSGQFTISNLSSSLLEVEQLWDIDNDGDLDLICQNLALESEFYIQYVYLENTGSTSQWPVVELHLPVPHFDPSYDPVFVDHDQDGNFGFLFVNDNQLQILQKTSGIAFDLVPLQQLEKSYRGLFSVNANGDGLADLLMYDLEEGISLKIQSETGFFEESELPANTFCRALLSCDINGDGYEDIWVQSSPNSLCENSVTKKWLISEAAGSYQLVNSPDEINVSGIETSVLDYDNDGVDDVWIVDEFSGRVMLVQADGQQVLLTELYDTAISNNTLIEVADLDGDEDEDLLLLNLRKNRVYVCRNNGNDTFGDIELYLEREESLYEKAKIYDFDKDGLVEILLPEDKGATSELQLLTLDSEGGYVSEQTLAVLDGYLDYRLVDINQDGWMDIAYFGPSQFAFHYLQNDQSGGFEQSILLDTQLQYVVEGELIVCADRAFFDYDLDGDLDYLLLSNENFVFNLKLILNEGSSFAGEALTLLTLDDVINFYPDLAAGYLNDSPESFRIVLAEFHNWVYGFNAGSLELLQENQLTDPYALFAEPFIDFDLDGQRDLVSTDWTLYIEPDHEFVLHQMSDQWLIEPLYPSDGGLPKLVSISTSGDLLVWQQVGDAVSVAQIMEEGNDGLIMVPNPAQHSISIASANEEKIQAISIFDSQGRLVYRGEQSDLPISNWPVGLYFCIADIGSEKSKGRFTIAR